MGFAGGGGDGSGGGSGTASRVVLSDDVANANAVANTLSDVTGLAFPMLANTRYKFRFVIDYTTAAATAGSRWTLNGPADPTSLAYTSRFGQGATAATDRFDDDYNSGGSPSGTSDTGRMLAIIEGIILNGANAGDMIARFSSEVANSAVTAKAGSYVEYDVLA